MFSRHNEIKQKENRKKSLNTWKVKRIFPNNTWAKEEALREIKNTLK